VGRQQLWRPRAIHQQGIVRGGCGKADGNMLLLRMALAAAAHSCWLVQLKDGGMRDANQQPMRAAGAAHALAVAGRAGRLAALQACTHLYMGCSGDSTDGRMENTWRCMYCQSSGARCAGIAVPGEDPSRRCCLLPPGGNALAGCCLSVGCLLPVAQALNRLSWALALELALPQQLALFAGLSADAESTRAATSPCACLTAAATADLSNIVI